MLLNRDLDQDKYESREIKTAGPAIFGPGGTAGAGGSTLEYVPLVQPSIRGH